MAGALATGGVAQAQPSQGPSAQQPDLAMTLHLRPDQMGAFHAYQAATRPNPDQMAKMRSTSPQMLGALPTPQRLDRIGAFLNMQMQMFQHTADATRAFYSQLTPQQQQTFDHVTAPRSRGGPQG